MQHLNTPAILSACLNYPMLPFVFPPGVCCIPGSGSLPKMADISRATTATFSLELIGVDHRATHNPITWLVHNFVSTSGFVHDWVLQCLAHEWVSLPASSSFPSINDQSTDVAAKGGERDRRLLLPVAGSRDFAHY
eukprot:441794-Pelagomonas_calceolata.AAC.2